MNSKPKGKSTGKGKNNLSGASASGGFSLLTAAEQREQEKKNEKKATEDPYAFLSDLKDVSVCNL